MTTTTTQQPPPSSSAAAASDDDDGDDGNRKREATNASNVAVVGRRRRVLPRTLREMGMIGYGGGDDDVVSAQRNRHKILELLTRSNNNTKGKATNATAMVTKLAAGTFDQKRIKKHETKSPAAAIATTSPSSDDQSRSAKNGLPSRSKATTTTTAAAAAAAASAAASAAVVATSTAAIEPVLPQDEILAESSSMQLVLRRTVGGTTVSDLFDKCWSERTTPTSGRARDDIDGGTTVAKPVDGGGAFYASWLRRDDKQAIEVGEWEERVAESSADGNGEKSPDRLLDADPDRRLDADRDDHDVDDYNDDGRSRGGSWVGDWDGERYTHRRVVRYRYRRDPNTLGYGLGDPVVDVTQTQYYRAEKKKTARRRSDEDGDDGGLPADDGDDGEQDRSVLSITMEMVGEPFADSFRVQIRGVATRCRRSYSNEEEEDEAATAAASTAESKRKSSVVQLEFGVFVYFTRQVLLKGQIRQVTVEATRHSISSLFDHMLVYSGASPLQPKDNRTIRSSLASLAASLLPNRMSAIEDEMGEEDGITGDGTASGIDCNPFSWLRFCNPKIIHGELSFLDDIDRVLYDIDHLLELVLALPAKDHHGSVDYVRSELTVSIEVLDSILFRDMSEHASVDNRDPIWWMRKTPLAFQRHAGQVVIHPARNIRRQQRKLVSALIAAKNKDVVDPVLESMNVVVSKKMKGSLELFYKAMLAEKDSVFESWLKVTGKSDFRMEKWQSPKLDKRGRPILFRDPWNKEGYDKMRKVSYWFDIIRDLHLEHDDDLGDRDTKDVGLLRVDQLQYLRYDKDADKCVFAVTIQTKGLWFSDTFHCKTRWVVTPSPDKVPTAIQVKSGIFVVIKKYTVASEKIVSELTRLGREQQLTFLRQLKVLLDPVSAESADDVVSGHTLPDVRHETRNCFAACVPWLNPDQRPPSPGTLIASDDDLAAMIDRIRHKLTAVQVILGDRVIGERSELTNFYFSQLLVLRESLDNVVAWAVGREQGDRHDDDDDAAAVRIVARRLSAAIS